MNGGERVEGEITPEDVRKRLKGLVNLANEARKISVVREVRSEIGDTEKAKRQIVFSDGDEEISINRDQVSIIDKVVARQQTQITALRRIAGVSKKLLQQSLQNPGTIADAIEAADSLLWARHLSTDAAETIAEIAPQLFEQVKNGSAYADNLLALLGMSLSVIDSREGKPESLMRAKENLMAILKENEKFLEAHLSDRESLDAEQAYERFKTLFTMVGTTIWKSNWPTDMLAEHVAFMLQKNYVDTMRQSATKLSMQGLEAVFERDVRFSKYVLGKIFGKFGIPLSAYPDIELCVFSEMEFDENDKETQKITQTALTWMVEQLGTIKELESRRSGCTAELYSRYGIRWFSRYPIDLLIQQYDERNDQVPYVTYMSGTHDWNRSFFSDSDKELVGSMAAQFNKAGFAFRIVECKNKRETARTFIGLDDAYGQEHKISGLVVRAHGDKEHITLGEKKGEYIDSIDLEGAGFDSSRRFFTKDCVLVLDGCAMGRRRGVAQKASKVFDETYAPPGISPSGLESIIITVNNGKLHYDPIYAIGHKGRDISVPPNVYRRGRKKSLKL